MVGLKKTTPNHFFGPKPNALPTRAFCRSEASTLKTKQTMQKCLRKKCRNLHLNRKYYKNSRKCDIKKSRLEYQLFSEKMQNLLGF